MKINWFLYPILLAGLLSEEPKEVARYPTCNQQLFAAFKIEGPYSPRYDSKTLMCKQMPNSCCDLQSQIQIYQAWKSSGDQEKLVKRLRTFYRVYNEILKILEQTKDVIAEFIYMHENEDRTNCFLLAETI